MDFYIRRIWKDLHVSNLISKHKTIHRDIILNKPTENFGKNEEIENHLINQGQRGSIWCVNISITIILINKKLIIITVIKHDVEFIVYILLNINIFIMIMRIIKTLYYRMKLAISKLT